ncbi:MAG: PIN domain-containing protein [Gemmatimonadetes bacterium]|nr:PIN domain-containing protein [Gemmatimonadota bacterium]
MFVVDTNILVHALDRQSPLHSPCRKTLEAWRRQVTPWFVTWSILYEFLRVVTHPRVLRDPWPAKRAWEFVDVLLSSPGLDVLVASERHPAIAAEVLQAVPHLSGNILHDVHTAVLMREHGIKTIYTRDTDFHRFPFLETVDPVA